MRSARWLSLAILCLLAGQHIFAAAAAPELEGFDEIEEDDQTAAVQPSVQAVAEEAKTTAAAGATKLSPAPLQAAAAAAANATAKPPRRIFDFGDRRTPKDFLPEILSALLVVWYAINIYFGRRENEAIALAWAAEFCPQDAVFGKNFALLGPGKTTGKGEVLLRESNSSFTFHASGRRFCTKLAAFLELRRRQDLLSLGYYLVQKRSDFIDIEVHMNEGAMPPMVLFVGQNRYAKERMAEEHDLQRFTRKVDVGRDRIASWPSDKLTVYAEHSSLFYDVMLDSMVDQVFGRAAFEESRKYFRFLHFTTEDERSTHPRVLRFSFNLPPPDKMGELIKLMTAAVAFIDIVGTYASVFSPEAKKRATAKRQEIEAADFKAKQEERVDLVQQRREKKFLEEQEKMKRMTPAAREKYEAKRKQVQQRRQMKTKMIK